MPKARTSGSQNFCRILPLQDSGTIIPPFQKKIPSMIEVKTFCFFCLHLNL